MHTTETIQPTPVLCQRFPVLGMTCSHCEHAITTEVRAIPGVVTAVASAAEGCVTVESVRQLNRDEVAAAVAEAGYQLAP